MAARRALAKYVSADGEGLIALLTDSPWWNPLQLEHLLAAVHLGVTTESPRIEEFGAFVQSLNHSESLSVRSIAKRICDEQGWPWEDVTTASAQPVILLPSYASTLREAEMVIGGDTTLAWDLHQELIQPLLSHGLDEDRLRSEFDAVYWALEREYPWADDGRLRNWMKLLLTRFWLNPTSDYRSRSSDAGLGGSRSPRKSHLAGRSDMTRSTLSTTVGLSFTKPRNVHWNSKQWNGVSRTTTEKLGFKGQTPASGATTRTRFTACHLSASERGLCDRNGS